MIEQKTKVIIGNRIKTAINKRGLKQKDLAEILGYPSTQENTVSLWIKGKRSPSIEQLIKIATICETSVDYLVGNTESYSTDKVLQSAWDNLGLTNYSYELLTYLNEKNKPLSNFINFLLEQIPSTLLFDKMINYLTTISESGLKLDTVTINNLGKIEIISTDNIKDNNRLFYLDKLIDEILLNELIDEFKSLKEKYLKEKQYGRFYVQDI